MELCRVESCRVESCRVEPCRVVSCRVVSCRVDLIEVHGLRLKHLSGSDLISPFCKLFV